MRQSLLDTGFLFAVKTFVLATIDDFDAEVKLLRNNQEFMSFLKELSQEPATLSLGQLREELGLS
jgi:hypothetical protein